MLAGEQGEETPQGGPDSHLQAAQVFQRAQPEVLRARRRGFGVAGGIILSNTKY